MADVLKAQQSFTWTSVKKAAGDTRSKRTADVSSSSLLLKKVPPVLLRGDVTFDVHFLEECKD